MNRDFFKTKKEIEDWLNEHKVENYTLIPDEKYGFVVDVNGSVDLFGLNLKCIPIKFNMVTGDFYCSDNNLTNLKFSPVNVGIGFFCSGNKLTSLKYCPKEVGGRFSCGDNKITNLEFCPEKVGNGFYCFGNKELGILQSENRFNKIYSVHMDYIKKIEYENINNLADINNSIVKKNKI